MFYILSSPLDQFEVTNLVAIVLPILGTFNLSLTNLGLYSLFTFSLVLGLHTLANNNFKLVPSK